MPAATLGFQAYVAAQVLGQLPWKRPYFRLFGRRVVPAAAVAATLKAIFLMTAAFARRMPALVRPILKASSGPGGEAYAFGLDRVVKLINAACGHPRGYIDLFPDDAQLLADPEAWTLRKALPFDFAFMMGQMRVMEGLVFGEQYPELTCQLLETEIGDAHRAYEVHFVIPSVQAVGKKHGAKFSAPPWEHVEDIERYGIDFFGEWMKYVDLTSERFFELMDQ
jgi:hypothetical protein